jgi:hypothetical protein
MDKKFSAPNKKTDQFKESGKIPQIVPVQHQSTRGKFSFLELRYKNSHDYSIKRTVMG